VSEKERDAQTVAVRSRGGVDLGVMPVADFMLRLNDDITHKRPVGQS
jgi:threonyl-tRNA synthetase